MAPSKSAGMTSEILDRKDKAPNDHMALLMGCLKEHKLLFTVENANPNLFLTHKSNRGGLLLSPHNVHRNAAKIKAAGASMKNLTNAVAMELSSHGALRLEHIQKNDELISKAAGLLASINGGERYVSLGCGHTVAFCKTAQVGGITSAPELKYKGSKGASDKKGGGCNKIDVQALCESPDFATMIHKGWNWEVIPACVDEAFDGFSKIDQKALNTQNNANTPISELAVMMTLEASLSDAGLQPNDGDADDIKQMAVDNISAMCAPCSDYAGTLFDFVRVYGGGHGAPHVQFMDSVAKGFGCNVSLGGSYWEGLAKTQFTVRTTLFPLVRVALALANMTSDKVEDNVARLLNRGDINKVAGKAKAVNTYEAEGILKDCMDMAEAVGGIDNILQPLGKMFSRMDLKLADKEKYGRERACYSMKQLQAMFLEDVGEILGRPLTFDKWNVDATPIAATPTPTVPKAPSMRDHGNPEWVASQNGFKVGKMVVEKGIVLNPERIYTVFSIDADKATLHQAISYTRTPSKVDVTLAELITNWSVTNTEPPIEMDDPPSLPNSIAIEMRKLEIMKAIMAVHDKKKTPPLAFYRHPDELRTKTDIKAHALVLVPLCSMSHISTKNTGANTGVSIATKGGDKMFALPVAKPTVPKQPTKWGDAVCSPFWWVTGSPDKKAANMVADTITQNGMEVPILTNKEDIPAHTVLHYYSKPKAKSKPLQNIITSTEEDHSKKKQKRS